MAEGKNKERGNVLVFEHCPFPCFQKHLYCKKHKTLMLYMQKKRDFSRMIARLSLSDVNDRDIVFVVVVKVFTCHTPDEGIVISAGSSVH